MAKLKEPRELLEEIAKAEERLQPLYDELRENYNILAYKKYAEGASKGNYKWVTSNEFGTHGRKVQGLLSDGIPVFSYKLDNEKYETRKEKLSTTERFVYGAIEKANRRLLASPDRLSVHDAACFYTVHFGGCIPRVVVWEEDDQPVFDVRFWQPRNVSWVEGENAPLWVCNKRWISVDECKRSYPDADGTEDAVRKGYVLVRDYWDDEWRGVIVNERWASEDGKGDKGAPHEHGCDELPVHIFTAGAVPALEIGDTGREQILQWYSAYTNIKIIMDTWNKLLSYRMSLSEKEANRPMVGYYTDTIPKKPEESIDTAGHITWLRKDQEEIKPSDPMELTRTSELMEGSIKGMLSMGMMSEIAYGKPAGTSTATGIAMLMEANSSYLSLFKRCIEQVEQWIAMQLIRQAKKGEYKKVSIDGKDKRGAFALEFNTEELEEKKEINCELEMSSKVVDAMNVGIATQLVKSELVSKQTAQDVLLRGIVQDTDAEQERISVEKLRRENPYIDAIIALGALLKDRKGSKDEVLKRAILNMIANLANATGGGQQQRQQGNQVGGQNIPQDIVGGMQQPPQIDVPMPVSNAVEIQDTMGM